MQFETFSDAYRYYAKALLDAPTAISRGFETRELVSEHFEIRNPSSIPTLKGTRKRYLAAEILWYAAGSYNIDWIYAYSSFWRRICNADHMIYSNYGHRIFRDLRSFFVAAEMLRLDIGSRQAICHINTPDSLHASNKDIPCTLNLQFIIRDNKLHLITNMRSNDIWKGTTYDIPTFFIFQQTMLQQLRDVYPTLQLGSYFHHAGSLHVYATDYSALADLDDDFYDSTKFLLKTPLITSDGTPTPETSDMFFSGAGGALNADDVFASLFEE